MAGYIGMKDKSKREEWQSKAVTYNASELPTAVEFN